MPLRHLSELSDPPIPLQEGVFNQLFEVAEISNFSPAEQRTYESSLKYYRDLNNVVDTSRQEGGQAGRQEGWQEGRQEGIQEGIQEGRQEGIQEVARKMKAAGIPLQEIAAYTGLTPSEIERIE